MWNVLSFKSSCTQKFIIYCFFPQTCSNPKLTFFLSCRKTVKVVEVKEERKFTSLLLLFISVLLPGKRTHTTGLNVSIRSAGKPVRTQRKKVVIEEIIDGKVVSRTEDVDTEVLSKQTDSQQICTKKKQPIGALPVLRCLLKLFRKRICKYFSPKFLFFLHCYLGFIFLRKYLF